MGEFGLHLQNLFEKDRFHRRFIIVQVFCPTFFGMILTSTLCWFFSSPAD